MELHTDLKNKIDELQAQIAMLGTLGETYQHCQELKDAFPESEINLYSYASVTESYAVIYIYDCKSLEIVPPFVRFLRQRGHKIIKEYKDDSNCNSRTYYLDGIQIEVFLSRAENANCKYVQVGTKEVPVMELRCGQ